MKGLSLGLLIVILGCRVRSLNCIVNSIIWGVSGDNGKNSKENSSDVNTPGINIRVE